MIREFKISDTEQVMKLWLSGNEDAHPFYIKNTGISIIVRYRKR